MLLNEKMNLNLVPHHIILNTDTDTDTDFDQDIRYIVTNISQRKLENQIGGIFVKQMDPNSNNKIALTRMILTRNFGSDIGRYIYHFIKPYKQIIELLVDRKVKKTGELTHWTTQCARYKDRCNQQCKCGYLTQLQMIYKSPMPVNIRFNLFRHIKFLLENGYQYLDTNLNSSQIIKWIDL